MILEGRALGLLVVFAELAGLGQLLILCKFLQLLPFGLCWHAEGSLLRLLLPKGRQLLLFKLLEILLEHCNILQLFFPFAIEFQLV